MEAANNNIKERDDRARAARLGSATATTSAVAGTSGDPGPSAVWTPQPKKKG